jgi:hypothetical protein
MPAVAVCLAIANLLEVRARAFRWNEKTRYGNETGQLVAQLKLLKHLRKETPMFAGIAKLFGAAPSAAIDALVRQVADLSLESVVGRVAARVDEMTLSEARGYVRARASQVVRRHTHVAIAQYQGASEDWACLIVPAATERIVPQVLRQTGVGPPALAVASVAHHDLLSRPCHTSPTKQPRECSQPTTR